MTWLWLPSPHFYRERRGFVPDLLVMHYTAGKGEVRSVARLFSMRSVERSAHLIIGRDAQVGQCVDLDDGAFHAGDGGRSRFPRPHQLDASDFVPLQAVPTMPREVNCRSVGVEVCNRGWAPRGRNPYGKARHANPASSSTEWESFNDEQLAAIAHAVERVVTLRPTIRFVCGHEDVTNQYTLGDDPKTDAVEKRAGAKVDPGPLFPWSVLPSSLTRVRFDYERIGWTKEAA